MFSLAVFIGIYSYGIFFLGILGVLTRTNIVALTLSWFVIFFIYNFRFDLKLKIKNLKLNRFSILLLIILISGNLVNLIGTLGPELGFDALWYHLTQPKLWLQEGLIHFIPNPVFRYSVTPQLTETLYVVALTFGNEIWAKLIHFSFGILSLIVTYKIARKFLSVNFSLLSVILLSGNLVFAWQSTTAYIDLSRTFFESLALLLLLEDKYTSSAVTIGLGICSKLVSIVSLPIFIFLLILKKVNLKSLILFTFYSILIPLPWLLFAFISTGNPIYPIGSLDLAMPISWNPLDIWNLFTHASDPVSPIYIITAPLIFFTYFKKWSRGEQLITAYILLALFFWFIFPHTGGSRFFLPYLPALSVLTIIIFLKLRDEIIKKVLIFLTLTLTLTTIVYRTAANWRYLPVILGKESKSEFLSDNLNFSFGDFYDIDNFLQLHLHPEAKIYPIGINNLFYINYRVVILPQTLNEADYLLIRHTDTAFLPGPGWQRLHFNSLTKTTLYGLK